MIARNLISEIREHNLSSDLAKELLRIENLMCNDDEIKATPRIHLEAPELTLENVETVVKEKYFQLMNEAKSFEQLP